MSAQAFSDPPPVAPAPPAERRLDRIAALAATASRGVLLDNQAAIAAAYRAVLELAAMAAAPDAEEPRAPPAERARDLIDALRQAPDSAATALARAGELALELRHGAVALRALAASESTLRERTIVAELAPAALVGVRGRVIDVLFPGPPAAAEAAARAVAARLAGSADAAYSAHEPAPDRLGHALREAGAAVELLRAGKARPGDLAGGTWRLLVRMGVRDPEALGGLLTSVLGPALAYDRTHGTELVATFATWLAHGANMNAAAAAMPAHRHTVAYRLERLGELCGLDPVDLDDRERLSLALKAGAVEAALAAAAEHV